jgi:hypothetical protein
VIARKNIEDQTGFAVGIGVEKISLRTIDTLLSTHTTKKNILPIPWRSVRDESPPLSPGRRMG